MSDQNIILDALVYSSIDNIISPTQFRNKNGDYWNRLGGNQGQTTANQLDENTSSEQAFSNFRKSLFGTTESGIGTLFRNLLSQTTIKRACCLGYNSNPNDKTNFETSIKIPYVEELAVNSGATIDIINNWRKLGYISKSVLIPKSMCPIGYNRPLQTEKNSTQCDTFMRAYCENAKELYNLDIQDLNTTYSDNEFMNVNPECGCFADRLKEFGGQAPPLCYSPRCNFSNTVYPDQNSRVQGGCPVNQCVAILNLASEAALGGTAGLTGTTNQSCFSPETQKKYGLPSVTPPNGLTPPPPSGGVTSLPPKKAPSTASTPRTSTQPSSSSPSSSDDTIIQGLSNTTFYAIVGGIGGLILIIIIVIIVMVIRNNKPIRKRKFVRRE